MTWLNAGAFAGLALLAGPIVVHLLLRHRAKRVPFPSLRFLRPSRTAAVRLRLPSDLLLLLLRVAIVAFAVLALAQPLLLTPPRLSAWNARIARAVVLDVSESMRPATQTAAESARAEAQSASFAFDVPHDHLGTGLRKAVVALAGAPPARREIVVISDFQWGALRPGDLEIVPPDVGLRFIQVGTPQSARRVRGLNLFRSGAAARQEFVLAPEATSLPTIIAQPPIGGVVVMARPADLAAVEALQRAIAAAGTPAPSPQQPITVALAGAELPASVRAPDAGWMLETLLRLRADDEIAAASAAFDAVTAKERGEPWRVLFRDRRGGAIVSAAAGGVSLLIDVAAPPSAFVSAAVVRGALSARQGSVARPEEEIHRVPGATLAAFARAPAPVEKGAPHTGQASDARWCWLLVLALLGIEAVVRRERRGMPSEARADAA